MDTWNHFTIVKNVVHETHNELHSQIHKTRQDNNKKMNKVLSCLFLVLPLPDLQKVGSVK